MNTQTLLESRTHRAPVLPFLAVRHAGLWRVRIGASTGTHTTFLGAYRRARWGL